MARPDSKRTLADYLRGTVIGSAMITSTVTFGTPMLAVGLLGALAPAKPFDDAAIAITNRWLAVNSWLIEHALPNIEWHLTLPEDLKMDGQYLLTCNHQSWVDTTVMQYIGLYRMPLTRFFTKWELVFIPFLGLSFKILGFPMMKRHSKAQIAKNPALRQQDFDEARRACEKLTQKPYTLLNYLEGTRFTAQKHAQQQSPYTHLLKPKAGGMALALNAMGDKFRAILDVTIVYPDGVPTFGEFLSGKLRRVVVRVRRLPIPEVLLHGDYGQDAAFREAFSAWVQQLWRDKDAQISALLLASRPAGNKSP